MDNADHYYSWTPHCGGPADNFNLVLLYNICIVGYNASDYMEMLLTEIVCHVSDIKLSGAIAQL